MATFIQRYLKARSPSPRKRALDQAPAVNIVTIGPESSVCPRGIGLGHPVEFSGKYVLDSTAEMNNNIGRRQKFWSAMSTTANKEKCAVPSLYKIAAILHVQSLSIWYDLTRYNVTVQHLCYDSSTNRNSVPAYTSSAAGGNKKRN